MPVPPDLPQIVVEIAPPETAADLKGALLDACTKAAQGAACIEAGTTPEDAPGVVAIVSWRDPGSVRLEVALRREKEWVAREITFDEHDVPLERWRTVGLVIGTLGSVIARGETPEAPATAVPAEPPPAEPKPVVPAPNRQPLSNPPAPSAPSPPPPPRVRIGWLGIGAISGSAYQEGLPRLGGELGGAVRVTRSGLHGSAALSYSEGLERSRGVRGTWTEGSLGVAIARELGQGFVGVGRADGFCERFNPIVALPDAASPRSGERWLGGARLGADLMWWGLDPVALLVGAAARWTAGTTEVRTDGATVGTTPAFGYFLHAGVAYGFR